MQLALLNVFLAASTVRNILHRPQPPGESSPSPSAGEENKDQTSRSIPTWYPNHVWSVDRTIVPRWGFWRTYVLVASDHFSKKIISVVPLEGPNAGWVVEALTKSFEGYGTPRHLITDQEPVFRSSAFADLLERHSVKHRFGGVGKQESIAVTERAIKTLKYEWLKRAAIIKGYNHLEVLSHSFEEWCNDWQPHMTLQGARPADVFAGKESINLQRDAKRIPPKIERRVFPETRTTAYRLAKAA